MKAAEFVSKLEKQLRLPIECVVTQNRTTMLRVIERRRDRVRLSVHEMFLAADEEVMASVVAYVRGARKDRALHNKRIRQYIHAHYGEFSHARPKVRSLGSYYDLGPMLEALNQTYFNNELQLAIGWFKGKRPKRRILFGKYQESVQLIGINDFLDSPWVPDFFLRYVIYHEMVHAVVPSYMDEKGRCRMHGAAFKERERAFVEYDKARKWEQENKERFFGRA